VIYLCDFCSEYAVFSIVDEFHYKDKEGYLRVRAMPYVKRTCRKHEKLIEKRVYYSTEELDG
jgi:hypothetical protein